jgi:hypothetical protein
MMRARNDATRTVPEDAPDTMKPKDPRTNNRGSSAREICDQVDQVRDWITQGWPAHRIRRECLERWGLKTRTAENRIYQARREMVRDVGDVDRKEVAAALAETCLWILDEARNGRQLSNALGAARLHAEILGVLERKG